MLFGFSPVCCRTCLKLVTQGGKFNALTNKMATKGNHFQRMNSSLTFINQAVVSCLIQFFKNSVRQSDDVFHCRMLYQTRGKTPTQLSIFE